MPDFKTLIELNSRNNKIVQINNLLYENFDAFTNAIYDTEVTLIKKIEESKTKTSELNYKLSNYTEENKGIPTDDDFVVLEEILDEQTLIYSSTEHLTALTEMKIVYLFKNLEINMKTLIQIAYPKIKTKNFYQWDKMVLFFNSIDISLSKLDGYQEAFELRKVNNSIKHSDTLSDELKVITEFKSQTDYNAFNLFHQRVKSRIESFFNNLTLAVIDNLFNYDEQRINNICNDYAEKMDSKTLELFIESLKMKIKN